MFRSVNPYSFASSQSNGNKRKLCSTREIFQATSMMSLQKYLDWDDLFKLVHEVKALNLGFGSPDFAPPDNIRKALTEICLDEDNTLFNHYTRGSGHLRLVNAIGKLYSTILNRSLDNQENILVTAGAYEAIFVAINGLVNPGDEVIIIEPFFLCFEPQVKLAGGVPVFVSLKPTKFSGKMTSADWKLDPSELERAFTPRTKAIIINTPNNPLGKVFNLEELTFMADLCKKHNVIAIMDEVYEWMTYDGVKHIRMATLPGMWERCITIGSAGKTFLVPGWRIGWAIGSKELLALPKVVHQHALNWCPSLIQEVLAKALETEIERFGSPDCYFETLPVEYQRKRDKLVKILQGVGLNPVVPQGGYFILVDIKEMMSKVDVGGDASDDKDMRFVKWLCRHRKLLGIPSSSFYSNPDHSFAGNSIRLCFVMKDENLDKAGEILRQLKLDIDTGKV